MTDVVICQQDGVEYPTKWNPSEPYPEYPFPSALSKETNVVYAMVRECLHALGLDAERYGTKDWNPLGELVSPGKTILIKPNFVLHVNRNKDAGQNRMDCLVTHPSVIRAVCDYCLIALQGKGRIVIGDAPVQDCDIDALFEKMRYPEIVEFYEGYGVGIVSFEDFRAFHTRMNRFRVICDKVANADGVEIDLGSLSQQRNNLDGNYVQVANYDRRITTAYHSGGKHIYSVAKTALEADLVVNIPKPKTHRLAGMTGAMKNLVGIACAKETLPHRTSGDPSVGGDSYQHKSILKRIADYGLNLKTYQEKDGSTRLAAFTWLWAGCFCFLSKKLAPDPYLLGSWSGNDTIWRTIADLVFIMTYCDKSGSIQQTPQRKFLSIADGVVSGEGAGPLRPSPKRLGALVAGCNLVQVDAVLARMMGFPVDKIPLLREVCSNKTKIQYIEPIVVICAPDNEMLEMDGLSKLQMRQRWQFEPHPSWAQSFEKRDYIID